MMEATRTSGAAPEDEELVRRARDGDTEAAGQLVARYRVAIERFCHAYLGRVHDAEDAAQDVVAKVVSGHRLPEGRFRPWLYRVARAFSVIV